MKYKISNVYNPYDFIKNGCIKIHPWIPNGKYCIKRAPMNKGFGEYRCFSVEVNTRDVTFDNETRTYGDIYFDTEQYDWSTNDILIVDDTIWLEAIKGGLQWFKVEEVGELLYYADQDTMMPAT